MNPSQFAMEMTISTLLSTAILIISIPQAALTASSIETIAYSGGKVTLSCKVESDDIVPPLTWEKPDGSILTSGSEESRFQVDKLAGTLTISGSRSEDSGLYLCHKTVAGDKKNLDGTQSAAASTDSRSVVRNLVQIIDLPRFLTPASSNRTVKTGSSEIFPCKATDENGNAVPVFWTKVGAPLDPKSSKRNPDGSLSLKNITKEMAGVYVCSALLLHGEGRKDEEKMGKEERREQNSFTLPALLRTKSESTMKLTVKDSNIFTVEPTNQEVVAGQDVFFHCSAAAPVIYWELHHQDGQKEPLFRVQQNHDQRMGVFPNNTLYIREVRPDKDPLGVTCVAEAEQSEQSHAKLIVKDHFGCKVPRFIQTPNAVVTPEDSTVLLRCTVHNLDNNANVAWYFRPKQGTSTSFKLLEPSTRRMFLPSGDLQILFTRNEKEDSDSGEYECVVMCNNTIQDLVTARVEIAEKSSSPQNVQVASMVDALEQDAPYLIRINSSEAELSWQDPSAEMCGVLEYFCDDSSMSVWNRSLPCRIQSDHSVKISGLKSGKQCFAAVRSRNIKTGFTAKLSPIVPFTVTSNKTSAGEISEDQIKATLSGELVSFSKLRLHWDVYPAIKYSGFNIKCQCTINNSLHEVELKTPDGSWRSTLVESLNSSVTYECYVLVITSPGKHVVTNAVSLTTTEVPPPPAPSDLTAQPNGPASMLVKWTKPNTRDLDPQITGYQVWCYNGEQLIQRKVLKLGPNVTEVSLPLQLDYPQLRIQVAAMAGNVVGLPSNPVQIKFTSVEDSESEPIGGIFREMWVLIVAGVVVWLLLFIICVIIIKRYVSEKMSASGAANTQYCSLEPCRPLPGIYGNRFDEDKHHNWGHSGEIHTLTPFNGYTCVTVSNNLDNAPVLNHEMMLQNGGTLMGTAKHTINNLEGAENNLLRVKPLENYPETQRSAPNLVSDIGSDESYEEIPVGETSPRGAVFQGDHVGHPSHYSPTGPHYVVYDTGDYSQLPSTVTALPMDYHMEMGVLAAVAGTMGNDNMHAVQVSQNQSNHSTLSAPANSRTSTLTPSHAVHLRPKMGSNALMLRTTSIHSCMGGNKISNSQVNSQPVTILPRNSTIMPLVGVASVNQPQQPITNQGSDFTTSPQYTNSSIDEAAEDNSTNIVPPELPAHHPSSRPYYQKPEPPTSRRSSPQFIAETFSPTYEELPSVMNSGSVRSSSSQASSPPLSSLCRKHSLKNKSRNIENSVC